METPKGKLIPIGGNEARDYDEREDSDQKVDFENGVLKDVLSEIPYRTPRIEVLTLASKKQKELAEDYTKAFKKLGYNIGIIRGDIGKEIDTEANIKKLNDAHCLFLTGGDQVRLKKILAGTKFLETLKKKYIEEDFVIAGTSAGAMILPGVMIDEGGSEESLLKGIVNLSDGIDLLPQAIIDTHFLTRGRISRLIEALLKRRDCIGIGICEDTAVVITKGYEITAIGSGSIVILDTSGMKRTNYDTVKETDPVYIDSLKIHFLSKGTRFNLKERIVIPEEIYA